MENNTILQTFKTLSSEEVNKVVQSGETLLTYFCRNNDAQSVKALLENPAIDLTVKNSSGKTALDVVISNGNFELLDLLLKKSSVKKIVPKWYNYNKDTDELRVSPIAKLKGCTPLMHAILKDDEELVKKILKNNQETINIQNDLGWTALHIVSHNSRSWNLFKYLNFLLESGADVNIKTKNGYTALYYAAVYSNNLSSLETVKMLLEFGTDANIKEKSGITVLMLASSHSNINSTVETIKILLEFGADPNIQDNNRTTALMGAANFADTKSNLETVKILLEFGADVNLQNFEGATALMFAAKCLNNPTPVKLLLDFGADINIQDKNGNTALMFAVRNSKRETVKLLLRFGADPKIKDVSGKDVIKETLMMEMEIEDLKNEIGLLKATPIQGIDYINLLIDQYEGEENIIETIIEENTRRMRSQLEEMIKNRKMK